MPGKYFIYVPFEKIGNLEAGIGTWMSNSKQMADIRSVFENVNARYGASENASMDQDSRLILRENLRAQMHDLKSQQKKDRWGNVGLDQRKWPARINHYDQNEKLRQLAGLHPFEYTLYVIGHSVMGSQSIFNESPRVKGTEELNATALVDRMIRDGLPRDAFNIKLLACYGASADEMRGSTSFLERFVRQLEGHLERGRIRGYREPVFLREFYAGPQRATKTAATLNETIRTNSDIRLRPGTLGQTSMTMAFGVARWPGCSVPNCHRPARYKCASCSETYYCSVTHQQQNFLRHSTTCPGLAAFLQPD